MFRVPTTWAGARLQIKRILVKIRRNVPPGFRWIIGLLLMIGGVFAILPVLGLWMLPAGLAVFLLDIKSLRNWYQERKRPR